MHQSASYLATDEDERRCDDLPVFDKCVFHLVGERSTEEKSQREGTGEGKREPAREGVKQKRCERETELQEEKGVKS